MQYGHNAEALKSIDHADSVILSASIDRSLHLFDKSTGEELHEIELGGIGKYYC